MFFKTLTIAASVLMLNIIGAAAQESVPIGNFKDWSAATYQSANGKVCFIYSLPSSASPVLNARGEKLDHGENFFLVVQQTGQNLRFEPQINMGYALQANSKVIVTIDGRQYSFNSRGKSAFFDNPAEEPSLIAAMRAGSTMKLDAVSGRGNKTSYTFSLSGVTAGLQKISSCS